MRVINQPRGCMWHIANSTWFPFVFSTPHPCWGIVTGTGSRKGTNSCPVLAGGMLKWMDLWNFAAATSHSFHRKERTFGCFPEMLNLPNTKPAASTGDSDNSSISPSLVPALLLGAGMEKHLFWGKKNRIWTSSNPVGFFSLLVSLVCWVFSSFVFLLCLFFWVFFCSFLSWKDKIFSCFSSLLVLCYFCVLPVESLTVTGLKLLSLLLQLQVKTFSSNSAKQDLVHWIKERKKNLLWTEFHSASPDLTITILLRETLLVAGTCRFKEIKAVGVTP